MVIIIFQFLSQSKIAVDVNIAVLCITSHAVWLKLSFAMCMCVCVCVFVRFVFLFQLVLLVCFLSSCCMQRFVGGVFVFRINISSPAFTLSLLLFQLNKLLSLSLLLLRSNVFCFCFWFFFSSSMVVRFISNSIWVLHVFVLVNENELCASA